MQQPSSSLCDSANMASCRGQDQHGQMSTPSPGKPAPKKMGAERSHSNPFASIRYHFNSKQCSHFLLLCWHENCGAAKGMGKMGARTGCVWKWRQNSQFSWHFNDISVEYTPLNYIFLAYFKTLFKGFAFSGQWMALGAATDRPRKRARAQAVMHLWPLGTYLDNPKISQVTKVFDQSLMIFVDGLKHLESHQWSTNDPPKFLLMFLLVDSGIYLMKHHHGIVGWSHHWIHGFFTLGHPNNNLSEIPMAMESGKTQSFKDDMGVSIVRGVPQ